MQKVKSTPLLYLWSGDILSYKYGTLLILDKNTYAIKSKIYLDLGWKETLLSRINIFHRLFRLGIRNAHQIDNKTVLLFVNKRFYEYNLENRGLVEGFAPPVGIRALNISSIKDIAGFDDMIVFGGYFSNINKREVHIYKRINYKCWESIYTFKHGTINHVHSLVPDQVNKCVWILTGDFGEAAAIWKATIGFEKVEPIVAGDQSSRSCVAFSINGKLLYATDTPFSQNSIRLLENVQGKWQSMKVMDIAGPCVYGCKVNDAFVFSTTVEPDGRDNDIFSLLKCKRGSGIVDNYTHLYAGTLNSGFREIYKSKKDIWFPILFQFGTLKFPSGTNSTEVALVEHVATTKYDCRTVVIKINK